MNMASRQIQRQIISFTPSLQATTLYLRRDHNVTPASISLKCCKNVVKVKLIAYAEKFTFCQEPSSERGKNVIIWRYCLACDDILQDGKWNFLKISFESSILNEVLKLWKILHWVYPSKWFCGWWDCCKKPSVGTWYTNSLDMV